MTTQKTVLHQISSRAWEHPADRAALNTLKKVPGLDKLLSMLFGATSERSLRLMYLASSVRVSDKQFVRVKLLFDEVCKTFDIEKRPEIYVSQSTILNAFAVGMDNPFIVLNSGLVERLDDEELTEVLGHELGHIMSGHMLYRTLFVILQKVSKSLVQLPVPNWIFSGVYYALQEWSRKSELSADRAGLLATQNPDVSLRVAMKLAGGNFEQMDVAAFLEQAEEYNKNDNAGDTVFKFLNIIGESHPFASTRALEIVNWVRSGDYDATLQGIYPRRTDAEKNASVWEDVKEASEGYANDFKDATESTRNAANASQFNDQFKQTAQNVSDKMDETTKKAKDFFDDFFKNKNA
ncbi:Zn-dependent protease with chaperone function [Bernardetia litoralis DSM 6794]|uniref:Zn-dependent protease with chaperone function n=1 Tax=Bernardetia litoralis (strain ATCC 23117 / DSM 6794 / NBRC 15988 / NCIMB 1366 / Fx l1 / Sio-4) TaxID=880071 RepID=I4AG66_BERLS|nr:M48 family metallopeptidase [Bernardetia litoralis]AFM02951.1 Zn-dependent protease with chaperone function [Bernardetia litoralis DSM 6794]